MSMTMTSEQKQQLKKYGVYACMGIIFLACMWLLFSPSDTEKQQEIQGQGFNADIPEPKQDEIIGDKKDAYEHEQMLQKRNDRMQSLQDYTLMLEGSNSNQKTSLNLIPDEPSVTALKNKQEGSTIGGSVSAYQDINKTLGNFYEKPKDDPEKEELKRKLEEIEKKLSDQEDTKSSMDEQLALMEKSYEMAAKYMPQTSNQGTPFEQSNNNSLKSRIDNYSPNSRETRVTPIRTVNNQSVSALQQEYSNLELFEMYDQVRNTGFNTLGGELGVSEKNTIAAVVQGDQTLIDGQSIRLRLTEPLMAGSVFIPENTMITGQAKVQGERLNILIASIEYKGTILPVELTVYDSDGQKGINIPNSLELNAIKEIAANMGQSMGTSISITSNASTQIASDLTRGLIQGTSQYMQKKIKQVKVNIKSGYRIMLMPKQ